MSRSSVKFFVGGSALLVLAHLVAALAALLWLGDRWNLPLAIGCLAALYALRFPYPVPVLAYLGAHSLWGWSVPAAALLAAIGAALPIGQGWRAIGHLRQRGT